MVCCGYFLKAETASSSLRINFQIAAAVRPEHFQVCRTLGKREKESLVFNEISVWQFGFPSCVQDSIWEYFISDLTIYVAVRQFNRFLLIQFASKNTLESSLRISNVDKVRVGIIEFNSHCQRHIGWNFILFCVLHFKETAFKPQAHYMLVVVFKGLSVSKLKAG